MSYSQKILIEKRLKKAEETYEQALLMAESKFWNAAINRLYYACFYSVGAYFAKEKIETRTHRGAKAMFHKHVMKTGKLDHKWGEMYNKLFDRRIEGDYDDYFEFDSESVEPYIIEVKDFIKEMEILVLEK